MFSHALRAVLNTLHRNGRLHAKDKEDITCRSGDPAPHSLRETMLCFVVKSFAFDK